MNWKKKNIHLGNIEPGKNYTVVFEATKELEVLNFKPTCDSCTIIKEFKNNILTAIYTSGYIPYHMRHTHKTYNILKGIIVTYKDGTQETLTFTAVLS